MKISEVDEGTLIGAIVPFLPTGCQTVIGPGDDCAVVKAPDSRYVITTDMLVEGSHFKREWSSAFEIGQRAAAQNLADVAAMGAHPTSLVCSLALPPSLEVSWLVDFAKGLADRARPLGCGVVGGDLTQSRTLAISVTALGDMAGLQPVLRSGAKVGDRIVLAGTLGYSATGLELLSEGRKARSQREQQAVQIFRAPNPPLQMGPTLAKAGASAMMDVSDGLLKDARRIAKASQVRMDLDYSLLKPFISALEGSCADPLDNVLCGGEDHALLATIPSHIELPTGLRAIGKVMAGEGVCLDGKLLSASGGWESYRH